MWKFSALFLLFFSILFGGCSLFKTNGVDKDGERHGKYVIRWDEKTVMQKGRYSHGQEKGTWKHYDIEGNLVKKEKYKDNQILTTHFRQDRSRESQGIAYFYFDEQYVRYSWEGIWHYFEPTGDYSYSVNYVRGEAVDTVQLQSKKFMINERIAN